MAIALIRSTENGDLFSVEYAAGLSTVDLTISVAGRNLQIRSGTLLISGAAAVQLLEETTATPISGKMELPSAAQWSIESDRAYATTTVGKKIQISRSASVAISGEILVSQ